MPTPVESDTMVLCRLRAVTVEIPEEEFFRLHEMTRDVCYMCLAEMLKVRRRLIKKMNEEPKLFWDRFVNITYAIVQLTGYLKGEFLVNRDIFSDENRVEQLCDIASRMCYYAVKCKEHIGFLKSKFFNLCMHLLYNNTAVLKMKIANPDSYEEPIFAEFEDLFEHDTEGQALTVVR